MQEGSIQPSPAATPLAALAAEYWEDRLAAEPLEATLLGVRTYDDRLADITDAGHTREIARLSALLERARGLDVATLAGADRTTHSLLVGEIENDLALRVCRLDEWTVDSMRGPQVDFLTLGHLQTVSTLAQGRALVARWRKMGPFLDDHIANLRQGLKAGRVATRGAVARVIAQLDEMLAKPASESALTAPGAATGPAFSEADRAAFAADLEGAVSGAILPAFARYRRALVGEVSPHARDEEHVGLCHVPGGVASYGRLIKVHTSLDLSADEIHRIGLEEITRVREEMRALGERALGAADLASIQARLRGDAALFFATRDEIEAKAAQALARANAAFPSWFGVVPRTPCVVKRIEAYEEKDCVLGYYRQPAIDGSRPGTYYINTYAPETRPRYEAEVLAFHEAVPGHHSQIAIAQELGGLPEFRKHAGVTAYIEGWALYTERLADEMGLYSGDLDRIGMLSFDAWRASRLVVDTGLHAMGWSRARAVAYMLENTILAENNIANEVDRYITMPGQALAYKLGQREIQRLRADAERRLGARFEIKGFHDALLEAGAVSLPTLREQVERWVSTAAAAAK